MLSHSNKGYRYYVTIGSRGRGKTYSGKKYLLKKYVYRSLEHWSKAYRDGKEWKCVWARLMQSEVDKVLQNNGTSFFEPSLLRQYHVTVKVENDYVYFADTRKKMVNGEGEIEYNWKQVIRVMAISEYYKYKGNQFTDYDEIIMDELVRAKSAKRTFDIADAFRNFIENIARDRADVRCLIYANAVDELDDLRVLFGFMPLPGRFGVYYLQKNGLNSAIIEYLDDSDEWKKRKSRSMANMLGSRDDAVFVNAGRTILDMDAFVDRKKLRKCTLVYKFVWRDNIYVLMRTREGRYVVDRIEYTNYLTVPYPIYSLSKRNVNTKLRYDELVKKDFKDIWLTGNIYYTDVQIAKDFRDLMEDVNIIERR